MLVWVEIDFVKFVQTMPRIFQEILFGPRRYQWTMKDLSWKDQRAKNSKLTALFRSERSASNHAMMDHRRDPCWHHAFKLLSGYSMDATRGTSCYICGPKCVNKLNILIWEFGDQRLGKAVMAFRERIATYTCSWWRHALPPRHTTPLRACKLVSNWVVTQREW